MDLKKNYWRVSERAKKIYECTLEKSCDGGWNSSCAPGHKGPLCGSCEAHFFYDAVKNRCEDCGDKIKATGSNIAGTILALLLLSVVGVVVRRFGLSEVWTNAVNVFREVVKGEAPEDIATEKMEEQDEPVQAKKSVVVDVEESAANEALEEAETAFLSAARRCFDMIDADGSGTLTRMEIAEASLATTSGPGSSTRVVLVIVRAHVLVPSTSSYCLRYFACLDYEGGYGDDISILQIDPMIACTSNSWKRAWMPYAVVAIFVYPVGVPLGFAVALWRLRARVNPPLADEGRDAPASSNVIDSAVAMHRVRLQQMGKLEIRDGDPRSRDVEFLFEEYEPRCYLFIVYEILRRIFLTGVLSMFRAGTISQIAIGLLATITELVIVFFYALMVFATAHVGQRDAAFASDAFTYILIVLMSSTFAAALAMVVLGQLGKQDRQDLFESLSKSVTSSFGALAAPKAAARAREGAAGGGGRRRTDAVRTDAADVAARTALGA
ncbi:hypothetical protein SO694_00043153 [Aureococcus anophagefferens]|uniref:EF-hand domain-containing protein n=1 Tax=Aureococcus anophagefferens TaxID=44056 RepID=A0ABR1G6N3_AURAN